MTLMIYNTLGRRKAEFRPLTEGKVRMYNCGPTVYNYAHIGNFSAFMLADLLRRYLEYKGYEVLQVMNITDVGHMTRDEIADGAGLDKLEAAAKREKKDPYEIARFYENAFFDDIKTLNIRRAHHYPRATEHIEDMIALVQKLLEKGYAYEAGSAIYFDLRKFGEYGKLSGNTLDKLEAGSRIAVLEEKRCPYDFALWKRDPNHIMQWPSPWGDGFPGWHLECSAMGMRYLGESFDIHTGGEDNIFPHHECEIAQSEAATGKPFVRYWLHTKYLLVDGRKMSKRLGNFYTIRDLLEKGFSGRVIRYLLLSTHYRIQPNFTFEGLEASRSALQRIDDFRQKLEGLPSSPLRENPELDGILERARAGFREALDDDLNASGALASIFDMIRDVNKLKPGPGDGIAVLDLLGEFDRILGVLWPFETEEALSEADIERRIAAREDARKRKDYARADAIRDELKSKGILLEDTPDGTRWKRQVH
jgi:cysteinyl-tRNA synthetase